MFRATEPPNQDERLNFRLTSFLHALHLIVLAADVLAQQQRVVVAAEDRRAGDGVGPAKDIARRADAVADARVAPARPGQEGRADRDLARRRADRAARRGADGIEAIAGPDRALAGIGDPAGRG